MCRSALALCAGGCAAAFAGIIVGTPALRIRGIYVMILTLGFGEIVRVFFASFEPTGGASGMGGIRPLTELWQVVVATGVALLLVWRIRHVRFGRAMIAVHEDDVAAEAMGINLTRTKLIVVQSGRADRRDRRRVLRPPGIVHRCQPVRLHAVGRDVSLCHPGRRRKSVWPHCRRGHGHAAARDAARRAGLAYDHFRHALGRDGDLASRRVAAGPALAGADERSSQRRRCEPPLRRIPRFERCRPATSPRGMFMP